MNSRDTISPVALLRVLVRVLAVMLWETGLYEVECAGLFMESFREHNTQLCCGLNGRTTNGETSG